MKKVFILFLVVIIANISFNQMNDFLYFDIYYNPKTYATNKIKECRIYQEVLTSSVQEKVLVCVQRFNENGQMTYERTYYSRDTLEGVLVRHFYDTAGRHTETRWTWIEDSETEITKYSYNSLGLLIKVEDYIKKNSHSHFWKVECQRLYYNEFRDPIYTKKQKRKKQNILQVHKRHDARLQ